MALTPSSSVLRLRTPAPAFNLPDTVSDRRLALAEISGGKATLLMFICNHCPYVKHVQQELVRLARDFQPKGVGFIAISSNDAAAYPEDAPEKMKETALRQQYPFPYLYDQTQDVARAYHVACTPDFYLFDAGLHLAYHGRLDGSTPGNGLPVTGVDLRTALADLLAGRPVRNNQQPSLGCSIKWVSRK